jgi:hypothetical protein
MPELNDDVALPPVAHDVSASTAIETAVVITLDGQSQSGEPLTYEIVDQPDNGTAVLVGDGPDVTYTPDEGFFGEDTFSYHVNDGFNDSNTATVTVTVEPLPPVARDVTAATAFETPVGIELDADSLSGEPLVYEVVSAPDNGTAVVVDDGPVVVYTPDPGFANTMHRSCRTATSCFSTMKAIPAATAMAGIDTYASSCAVRR